MILQSMEGSRPSVSASRCVIHMWLQCIFRCMTVGMRDQHRLFLHGRRTLGLLSVPTQTGDVPMHASEHSSAYRAWC
jgi:hypothetical protein